MKSKMAYIFMPLRVYSIGVDLIYMYITSAVFGTFSNFTHNNYLYESYTKIYKNYLVQ